MTQTPNTSEPTEIGRDWVRALALPAVLAGLLVAAWYGMSIEEQGYYQARARTASYVGFPLLLVLLPLSIWFLLVPFGAMVTITPEGLIDRRAGHGQIPWADIRNVTTRGTYIQLTLSRSFASTYRFTTLQRFLKSRRSSAGPTHLLIVDWCLDAKQSEVLSLIKAYRADAAPDA